MKVIVNKKWILMKETWFRLESEADPKRKRETQMQKRDKLEEKMESKTPKGKVKEYLKFVESETQRERERESFFFSLLVVA
jgi:hypothetical protein